MKYTYKNAALSALLLGASLAMPGFAIAFDLNGAWASDADNCTKVFVRKGSQVTFTDMSDVYGGGFIIEGDQITGKFARCRIKTREDDATGVVRRDMAVHYRGLRGNLSAGAPFSLGSL